MAKANIILSSLSANNFVELSAEYFTGLVIEVAKADCFQGRPLLDCLFCYVFCESSKAKEEDLGAKRLWKAKNAR